MNRHNTNTSSVRIIAVVTRTRFVISCAFLAAAGFLISSTAWAEPKKSLFFGIDGLGFGTQGFSFANTPFMDSLINGTWQTGYNGAYSDQAFAGGVLGTPTEQRTVSGPGWSTMLTGVWRDRHGVNDNGDSFDNGDYTNNPPYLATLKEAIPTLSTASYVYWSPIDDYIIGSIDNDGDPTNDVDFHASYHNDNNTVAAAVTGIGDVNGLDPDVVFVSVDLVDAAGHSGGSSSVGYKKAVETADGFVGQTLTAIANRPSFANEYWQIVVTADHGHQTSGGHGGQSDLERTIPFIVASQSVRQGILEAGDATPISHADVAPTVLHHFDVALLIVHQFNRLRFSLRLLSCPPGSSRTRRHGRRWRAYRAPTTARRTWTKG